MIRKIWSFDACLFSVSSHSYSEACALLREAEGLQIPLEIFCFADSSEDVLRLPARPLFRKSGYSHLGTGKPSADFAVATYCNQATLDDLRSLTGQIGPDAFVFFPTVTGNIVLAICQWLTSFAPGQTPWAGMCFLAPPDFNSVGMASPVIRSFFDRAFHLLTPELKQRMAFTCETEALSQTYEPIVGKRPTTLALPTWCISPAKSVDRRDKLQIAFLGDGRKEKGFALLPQICAAVRAARPQAKFIVQTVGHDEKLVERVAAELIAQDADIEVLQRALTGDELFAAMRESDLLLLPYDATKYRDRGSSLFTEGKALGVPMVMPAGTAIGEEGGRKVIAELFADFTAESISASIIRAIDHIDDLAMAARGEAQCMRASYPGYLAPLLRSLGLLAPLNIGTNSAA